MLHRNEAEAEKLACGLAQCFQDYFGEGDALETIPWVQGLQGLERLLSPEVLNRYEAEAEKLVSWRRASKYALGKG